MSKRRKSRSKAPSPGLALRSFDADEPEIKAAVLPTPERVAKGRFVREPVYAQMTDSKGEARGPKYVESYRRRDADLDLRQLRRRFSNLRQGHVDAALVFEADHEEAQLEPRLTADLAKGGGGGQAETFWYGNLRAEVKDARTRVHDAVFELGRAGAEARRVVVAIVLQGQTAQVAGAERYARGRDAAVSVAASLEAGLSVLAAHYATKRRLMDRDEGAAA